MGVWNALGTTFFWKKPSQTPPEIVKLEGENGVLAYKKTPLFFTFFEKTVISPLKIDFFLKKLISGARKPPSRRKNLKKKVIFQGKNQKKWKKSAFF